MNTTTKYGRELECVDRLYHLAGSSLSARAIGGDGQRTHAQDVAGMILARAATTLRAVHYLFIGGFESEAATVMRTIFELRVDLAWIMVKDTEARAERFRNSNDHALDRLAQGVTEAVAEIKAGDQRAPYVQGVAAEMAGIRSEIDPVLLAEFSGHSWTTVSLFSRAQDVGLERSYRTDYAYASGAAHSCGFGAMAGLQDRDGEMVMTIGPVPPETRLPLKLAVVHFLPLFKMAANVLGMPLQRLVEAERDAAAVFSPSRA